MGALVPPVLLALDASRSIRGILGLNPYTVKIRVRVWTGNRPGLFGTTYTDTDTPVTVGIPPLGPQNPTVRFVSNREIVASGGLYRDRDLRIGPLTPSYVSTLIGACCAGYAAAGTGGFVDTTLDPLVVNGFAVEVFWNVAGPSMPVGGAWAKRVQEIETAMHFEIVVRATGEQMP